MANTYNVCNKLQAIADAITQGGGGGGTTNYNDLSNKPTINGTTLSGNKTGVELGLAGTADISNINITGSTNTTGSTIGKGVTFYLNGSLCIALSNIAAGATFTSGTNYSTITIGEELSTLNSNFADKIKVVSVTLANGWSNLASFPTGYDTSNCTILSVVVDENGDGSVWRAGEGSGATGQRFFAEIYSLGVHVYNTFGTYAGRTARVVLMKL